MTITVDGSGITFGSGSQTEAITTNWGGLGSYVNAYRADAASNVALGSTIAGSSLQQTLGSGLNGMYTKTVAGVSCLAGTEAGSVTKGSLSLSGTWRVMTGLQITNTSSQLCVRIS